MPALTRFETDLLGELAADDLELYELMWLARGHGNRRDENRPTITQRLRTVLQAWVEDGWLELAPTSASSPLLVDVTDLVRLLDALGDAAADPIPGGPRLRLTAKAYRDVPWLGDPGDEGAAQQAAAPDGP